MNIRSEDLTPRLKSMMEGAPKPKESIPLETQFELHAEQSEAKLQDDIEEMVLRFLGHAERNRMDKKTTCPVGTPDFRCCYFGKYLAIECKVRPKTLSKEQKEVRESIIRAGGHYIVAYSTEDVRPWLIENEVKS